MNEELISWSDDFSVGYEIVDNQHKKLCNMVNELYNSFVEGDTDTKIDKILGEMISYTDYHFKTEEEMFEKHDYSDTAVHKKQHKDFVDQVTTFHNDFKAGSEAVTYEVMDFLKEWLLNHIGQSDKKWGAEFKSKNIQW